MMTNLLCHHISCTKLSCGKSIFQRHERPSDCYFLHFQMPSPSSVAAQVWFTPPPSYHLSGRLLSQYVLSYSPLFLLFFSVSKPVLKQLILKEQTLSFQFPLQSNLQSFWFDIQPAPWQSLQDSGMAQKSGTFLQAETLSKPCKPTGQECKSLLRSISWQLSQSVPRLRLASDLPAPHTTV